MAGSSLAHGIAADPLIGYAAPASGNCREEPDLEDPRFTEAP
jgi:hypothetical protein